MSSGKIVVLALVLLVAAAKGKYLGNAVTVHNLGNGFVPQN
jgi:hypothetical protein